MLSVIKDFMFERTPNPLSVLLDGQKLVSGWFRRAQEQRIDKSSAESSVQRLLASHHRGTIYRQMLPFIPFTPGLMSDCK